jgi:hypothetical protein
MPSGIADYSSEIVPYVAERADVDVFCPRPGVFSKPRVPRGATLRDPRTFDDLLDGYDAAFYHLGNNPYHEFVYKTAKDRPGIAVFHDADLHHLIAAVTIELRRDPTGYEDILREELGEVGGRVATLRRLGLATEFEKFVFPLIGHVASRAKGIVVHSEDARLKMLEVAPDVPMTVIPHHAGEPKRGGTWGSRPTCSSSATSGSSRSRSNPARWWAGSPGCTASSPVRCSTWWGRTGRAARWPSSSTTWAWEAPFAWRATSISPSSICI